MLKIYKRLLAIVIAIVMIICSTPIVMADNSNGYSVGDIIEFGCYPQSEVSDNDLISTLNAIESSWKSYGYMSGSGSNWCDGSAQASDYMRYRDVTYKDDRYRAVTFSTYRPGLTNFKSTETCYNYQKGNGYLINNTYWFKFEPIKWRVLDPNEGFVLCESLIDSQPFNNTLYGSGDTTTIWASYWKDSARKIRVIDYDNSSIKNWLNDDFLNTAFSSSERGEIASNSNGNISLLSRSDMLNSSYGLSSNGNRKACGTDYAKCQGLSVSNGLSIWLSRTAVNSGSYDINIYGTYYDGRVIGRESNNYGHTEMTFHGVRPAFTFANGIVDYTCNNKYPDEYNFEDDRYHFGNFTEIIPLEYFTTMFGDVKGNELYNYRSENDGGAGSTGHCFGMALTTAATILDAPYVTDYISWTGLPYTKLSSVNMGTHNMKLGISAKDYIRYGHIYQDSISVIRNHNSTNNDIDSLKRAVIDYVNGGAPVIIIFSGHAVLAVGIDGNDIFINDSNVPDTQTTLHINDDNTWNYSSEYNSENSYISYSTDVLGPYLRLVSRIDVQGGSIPEDEDSEMSGNIENHALGMEIVDKDKLLVVDSASSYDFSQIDQMLKLDDLYGSDDVDLETKSSESVYWLTDGNKINATNTSETDSTIKLAGNELGISATLPKDALSEIEIDENGSNNICIDNAEDKNVDVTFTTVSGDNLLDLTVSGLADSTVTTKQTETGVVITGISDGTVTLSKDDEVISTQEITDAISDIEIKYDKDGTTGEFDVDYDAKPCDHSYTSEITKEVTCTTEGVKTYTCLLCGDTYTEVIIATGHTDKNNDNKCDACGTNLGTAPTEPTAPSANCSHNCHKGGFMGFIWKIINFFNKLFRSNQYCACGAKHW